LTEKKHDGFVAICIGSASFFMPCNFFAECGIGIFVFSCHFIIQSGFKIFFWGLGSEGLVFDISGISGASVIECKEIEGWMSFDDGSKFF